MFSKTYDNPDIVEQLIQQLVTPPSSKTNNNQKLHQATARQQKVAEVDQLDISDVFIIRLSIFNYQPIKKDISIWHVGSSQLEQQDYKYLFAVASQAHFRRLEHPGYYLRLLDSKHQYPNGFFSSIEKDVPRTLSLGHPLYESLTNVLCAYAIRNPSLVYCQGMNYLAAYLLMNEVSAEQAFWIIACLVQNCLPDDYFKDLTTVSILTCIFDDLLSHLTPDFKNILVEAGMDASVLLVPWFVCLFSRGFINSVSAYILSYFMLQSQNHRPGYILLRISLAILSLILSRHEQLPYSRDFKTLKDTLELRVFEISLGDIKDGLEEIQINYDIYIKLEDYYRTEKKRARSEMLRNNNRKIPLPPCNKNYPICFHRSQIQKKLGAIENALILKNGLSIKEQMIADYLESDPQEQTNDISYVSFEQCEVGRLSHICHLSEQEGQLKIDSRHIFARQTIHRIELIDDGEQESVQHDLQLSTYEERFKEVSQYFVVDEDYLNNQELEEKNCDEALKRQFQQFSIEKAPQLKKVLESEAQNILKTNQIPSHNKSQSPENNQKPSVKSQRREGIKSYLGKVLHKVTDLFTQMQQIKQSRSHTQIKQPPQTKVQDIKPNQE